MRAPVLSNEYEVFASPIFPPELSGRACQNVYRVFPKYRYTFNINMHGSFLCQFFIPEKLLIDFQKSITKLPQSFPINFYLRTH